MKLELIDMVSTHVCHFYYYYSACVAPSGGFEDYLKFVKNFEDEDADFDPL